MDDGFKNVGYAYPGFCAASDGVGCVKAYGFLDRFLGAQNVGGGEIDLVDYRNDLEAVTDGQIGVGEGLRLDALTCVHYKKRAFAGSKGARDFIAEVDVARGIDEIELIGDAVVRFVHHANGVGLDGDATFALKIHVVEDLGLHFAAGNGAGVFEETVAQRRLSVVDVGDDCEVS